MTSFLALPQPTPVENTWAAPGLATVVAVALAAVVSAIVFAVRRDNKTSSDFLLGGRKIGVGQNTLAMVGTGLMYSTVIIISGHVSLGGFDAIMLLTAFTMSTIIAVLVYARPAANVGGFTLGSLFALRARERSAYRASAVLTLTVYGMFVIAILASIGLAASRMFTTASPASNVFVGAVIGVVGLVAIGWVYYGGMHGVTRMLAVKVVLFGALIAVLTLMVLAKYKFDMFQLLDDAQANAAPNKNGFGLLEPGRLFGSSATPNANTSPQDPWVHLSKTFSVAFGVIAMPFLFTRFLVAGSGKDAQRSSAYASMIAVTFWNCMVVVSLGATAILGGSQIGTAWDTRDVTLPKLADHLGGSWMSGALGGIALLSVAALFAVLLLNGVTSYVKDLNAVRGRVLEPAAELRQIRRSVLVIGVVSLLVGTAMVPLLTHLFIPSSIDVGATCVLPAVVYTLFWRRYNTAGLKWTVYGGLIAVAVMVLFSNGVSGDPANAIFPDINFKVMDFEPGLIGAPLGFLLGFIGTLTSPERNDAKYAEMRVRTLTGAVLPARKPAAASGSAKRDRDSGTVSAH